MEGNLDEDSPNIIIDNGSRYIKCGLSGEERPRAVFPSCVAYPDKIGSHSLGFACLDLLRFGGNQLFFGENAEDKSSPFYRVNYPIENRVVKDWDDMEKIWSYAFDYKVRVDPTVNKVMLTEAALNPKENREKMTEIMFESFSVPGLYIAIQAVLSLYSVGKSNGIGVDLGYNDSQFVPIFDGYALPHSILCQNFGVEI